MQPELPGVDDCFVHSRALGLLDLAMEDDPLEVPDHASGDRVGKYRLLRRLGEGGFGIVWHAEQKEPISREVALKVIRPGMDTVGVLQRFRAERRALERMHHPHIAAVLDAGVTDQGRPYFVMELVRGRPVTHFAQEADLDLRARLQLFMDICGAVQHAHQRALVHRDLKPSNILVVSAHPRPVPKVIDFGIAKVLADEGPGAGAMTLTGQGMVMGTPQYMAPEQASLTGEATDVRVDVYALGVILYELLTGCPPLELRDSSTTSLSEVLQRIQHEEVMLPSLRARRRMAAGLFAPCAPDAIRGDLDWILLKALEKSPERRYASASALAEDVERHLRDEPVSAGPPGRWYRLQKLARRNRAAVAVGAVFAVNLLVLAAVSTLAFIQEKRARAQAEHMRFRAELKEQDAATQSKKAVILAEYLGELLQKAGSFVEEGKNPEALRLALDDSVAHVEKLSAEPELQEALLGHLTSIYGAMGDGQRSLPLILRQFSLAEKVYGPADPHTLEVMLKLARNQSSCGNGAGALATYEEMERRWKSLGAAGRVGLMEARRQHARELARQKRGKEALAILQDSLPEAGESPVLQVGNYRYQADIQLGMGDAAGAAANLQKAVQILKAMPDSKRDHSRLGVTLQTLSRAEARLGRHEAAAQTLEESIECEVRKKGECHHTLIARWVEVSRHYVKIRRYSDAIRATDQAVAIARAIGHEERLPKALRAAAEIREQAGQPQAALAFRRECRILERRNNTDRGMWLYESSEIVRLLSSQGQHEEAEKEAMELWKHFQMEPQAMGSPDFRREVCAILAEACERWQEATGNQARRAEINQWKAMASGVTAKVP